MAVQRSVVLDDGWEAHLECRTGGSFKFWRIVLRPDLRAQCVSAHVTWGRIGTRGQSTAYSCATMADAQEFASRKVKEKLGRGYKLKDEAWAAAKAEKRLLRPLVLGPPASVKVAPARAVPRADTQTRRRSISFDDE